MSDARRRPSRDDDDDDDRPRRRRRDEEEEAEEEPRPRRARRDDPDADDDRPRRRSRDDDDEQEDLRPRKKKKKTPSVGSMDLYIWIGLGVAAVAALVFGILVVQWIFYDPFSGQAAAYTQPPGAMIVPGQPRPPVTKVVAVDMGAKKTDPAHWSIDSQYRASKPAEVTTVLQLNWRQETVGQYSNNGGPAMKWRVTATLVDLASKTILGQRQMSGSEPPASITVSRRSFGGSGRSGDKPIDQITAFVRETASMK
ncbi:MAG: hypothetical protein ACRC33_08175 [Gemmataceae bacterium]